MAVHYQVCPRIWGGRQPQPRIDLVIEPMIGYGVCHPTTLASSLEDGELQRELHALLGTGMFHSCYHLAQADGFWRNRIQHLVTVNTMLAPAAGMLPGTESDQGFVPDGIGKTCFDWEGRPLSLYHLLFHVLRDVVPKFQPRSIAILGYHRTSPLQEDLDARRMLRRDGRILPGSHLGAPRQIFDAVRDFAGTEASTLQEIYLLAADEDPFLQRYYRSCIRHPDHVLAQAA